jgi:hypothetical protein
VSSAIALPDGWSPASPKSRTFCQLIAERRLALCAAVDIIRESCTELQAPQASEFCFLPPGEGEPGWNDLASDEPGDLRSLCGAVAFLMGAGLAEERYYEGTETAIFTVMPWRLVDSVGDTWKAVQREQ